MDSPQATGNKEQDIDPAPKRRQASLAECNAEFLRRAVEPDFGTTQQVEVPMQPEEAKEAIKKANFTARDIIVEAKKRAEIVMEESVAQATLITEGSNAKVEALTLEAARVMVMEADTEVKKS